MYCNSSNNIACSSSPNPSHVTDVIFLISASFELVFISESSWAVDLSLFDSIVCQSYLIIIIIIKIVGDAD